VIDTTLIKPLKQFTSN